eukprot:CAMPEP_0113703158 /NCGR_PEP_ID=MMETSP0038_2-20120614/25670_1 /TAXON_ID=2898 /ORGANISM="Cryptomonas paramecium" /LENGTH=87 /DNA_ID=CAMNT_0000627521 /DNA_START=1290 /DNA_END=1553 /DNA_ORIENTATION=- /assembly_acc=CAM_ASM_000170
MPNISASKSTSQCHTFPPPSQHAPRRRLLPKDRGDAAVEGLERQHQVHVQAEVAVARHRRHRLRLRDLRREVGGGGGRQQRLLLRLG